MIDINGLMALANTAIQNTPSKGYKRIDLTPSNDFGKPLNHFFNNRMI